MFVRPKTSTLYVLANAFYQLIYVYSYHLCALTAVRLHNKFIPLIPFKCVAVYEQKCQLEFMHLWFLIWFICIINWRSVFFSAQALPICVCPYVCVFLYRKCLLFILGIASRMCLWTENANHMFRWLHFVNWFIYMHLLPRPSNSELCFTFCVSSKTGFYNLGISMAFF